MYYHIYVESRNDTEEPIDILREGTETRQRADAGCGGG